VLAWRLHLASNAISNDLQYLQDKGFIVDYHASSSLAPCLQDASDLLATCKHDASNMLCQSRDREETETETEGAASSALAPTKKRGKKELTPEQAEAKTIPPTIEQVEARCILKNYRVNPHKFFNHYESNGWKVGKNRMRDWHNSLNNWNITNIERGEADYREVRARRAAAEAAAMKLAREAAQDEAEAEGVGETTQPQSECNGAPSALEIWVSRRAARAAEEAHA